MENNFCLSFSDSDFQLLHLTKQDDRNRLHSAQQFNYESIKSIDQIISEDNVSFISKAINPSRGAATIPNV